ncbi:MAG: serine/threonine protein kinase [Deltaproteobacteria bacterium]|nr:serine/threonine protein kinase [Deltaproteobacteria bacterium]
MTDGRHPTLVDAPAGGAEDTLVGALVADRFQVERLIGEGGIGRVYLATQVPLGRKAALKVLHPHLSARKDVVERFVREARAASRLNHPGSVTVYDFGEWQGQLYIGMEYLEGPTLSEVIGREMPMSTERIVDLVGQLCDVLEAAHRMHLLHRDLKPENVLLVRHPDGHEMVKVVDFGLAFVVGDAREARLTRDDTVSGTPCFMAPEQVLNRPLDGRSDIYALGCVMYEMLTGAPPFDAPTSIEVLTMQLYDEPTPPSQRVSHQINRALEQIVLWALQKSPANRPQRCAELKAALARVASTPTGSARRPALDTSALLDREARVAAAGIAPQRPLPQSEDGVAAALVILLVEPETTTFGDSVAPIMRSQGALVRVVDDVAAAVVEIGTTPTDAVVADLSHVGRAGVEALAAALPALAAPVIVVGPDEDFDAMTRALELGVAEYVPSSQRATLPRKLRRAVERARRAKR